MSRHLPDGITYGSDVPNRLLVVWDRETKVLEESAIATDILEAIKQQS